MQLNSTDNGFCLGPQNILSYTALGQLHFSMSTTAQVGTYDYTWHWYDATGLRLISQVQHGSQYLPSAPPSGGARSYYVYDASDVAAEVRRRAGASSTFGEQGRRAAGSRENVQHWRENGDAPRTAIGDREAMVLRADPSTLLVSEVATVVARDAAALARTFRGPGAFARGDQLVRATLSIVSNIAEGCGRGTVPEFRRFLLHARGSAQEVLAQVRLVDPASEA